MDSRRGSAPPENPRGLLPLRVHADENAERRDLQARRGEVHQEVPAHPRIPGVGRGQPRVCARLLPEPVGGAGRAVLPGAQARLHTLHRGRPRRARPRRHLPDDRLHRGIQARDRPPENGDAVRVGIARLLRPQPLRKLAHARPGGRPWRRSVADRDRWGREIRQRLHQQARRGPQTRGESAAVHVRRGGLQPADQAPLHLQLGRAARHLLASTRA